jgi:hypothetical protein
MKEDSNMKGKLIKHNKKVADTPPAIVDKKKAKKISDRLECLRILRGLEQKGLALVKHGEMSVFCQQAVGIIAEIPDKEKAFKLDTEFEKMVHELQPELDTQKETAAGLLYEHMGLCDDLRRRIKKMEDTDKALAEIKAAMTFNANFGAPKKA